MEVDRRGVQHGGPWDLITAQHGHPGFQDWLRDPGSTVLVRLTPTLPRISTAMSQRATPPARGRPGLGLAAQRRPVRGETEEDPGRGMRYRQACQLADYEGPDADEDGGEAACSYPPGHEPAPENHDAQGHDAVRISGMATDAKMPIHTCPA